MLTKLNKSTSAEGRSKTFQRKVIDLEMKFTKGYDAGTKVNVTIYDAS